MNNIVIKNEEKIYEVRGTLVMLDSDLAKLYNMETKRLNENVKNNLSKFGNSTFVLTSEEYLNLRSKIATSSWNNYGGRRNNPRVFTYEGIEILNSILRKEDKEIIMARIKRLFDLKNNDNMALMPVNTRIIENLIYEIRGKQVMLDSDLAKLYECKNGTKEINQAVKNNPEKFPERYSFRLTKEESESFLVKNFDQKNETRGRKYTNPRVFTEQGVAMLATVLKSEVATKVSIAIMDAFVAMRNFIKQNQDIFKSLNNLNNEISLHRLELDKHERLINEVFEKFESKEDAEMIFFEGQIYDAYSKLIDIMSKAKNNLIVIDNYADKTTLDMIAKVKIPVILIAKRKKALMEIDLEKYQEQYNNLTIVYDDSFHDRFLILDEEHIYHCGTSLNHAGNKIFAINQFDESNIKENLLKKIKKSLDSSENK